MNIDELIKNATLSKDRVALNAYKNLKAEFQKVQTAKDYSGEWTSELELKTIAKYVKSLEDAILQFSESHRDDLITEYTDELEVLKKLLPEPVSSQEILNYLLSYEMQKNIFPEDVVKIENLEKLGIKIYEIEIPKKDMGKVIKQLKVKFPTADGKIISDIVKKYTA